MSTPLWGHYGDSGKGICIELDLKKLNPKSTILHDKVDYKPPFPIFNIPNDCTTSEKIDEYIICNQKEFFFTKTDDWKYENEYRLVSNIETELDISKAITAIIITNQLGIVKDLPQKKKGVCSTELIELEKLLADSDTKIKYLYPKTKENTRCLILKDAIKFRQRNYPENPSNSNNNFTENILNSLPKLNPDS